MAPPHLSPPSLLDFCDQHRLNLTHSSAAPLLGSAIALDDSQLTDWALAKVRDLDPYFSLLRSPYMRSQMSVALLRLSCAPKLNHLCRTLPITAMREPCQTFDRLCRDTLTSRLDIPGRDLGGLAVRQIVLPLRDGGLGISCSSLSLAAASLSSMCAAISDISLSLGDRQPHILIPRFWSSFTCAFNSLRDAHLAHAPAQPGRSAAHAIPLDLDPPDFSLADSPEELWSRYSREATPPHFQHFLAQPCRKSYHTSLLSDAPPFDLSRLRSLYGEHISRYLTALPTSPYTTFSDRDFALTIKFRLGIPIVGVPSSGQCPLCSATIPAGFNAHPMCCSHTRRRATNVRHNNVVYALNRFARRAGASTRIEPIPLDVDNRRPDLLITYADSLYTDVTIIQPDAPSKSSPLQLSNKQKT